MTRTIMLHHDETTERRQRIEQRIYLLLNGKPLDVLHSTYAAMYRAAREGGEKAVDAMAQVERELKAGQS